MTNGGNKAQIFGAQRQKLGSLKAACVPGETGKHPHPISVSTDGSLSSSQGPILSQLWLKVRFHSETRTPEEEQFGGRGEDRNPAWNVLSLKYLAGTEVEMSKGS